MLNNRSIKNVSFQESPASPWLWNVAYLPNTQLWGWNLPIRFLVINLGFSIGWKSFHKGLYSDKTSQHTWCKNTSSSQWTWWKFWKNHFHFVSTFFSESMCLLPLNLWEGVQDFCHWNQCTESKTCHRDQDRGPLLLLLETRLGSVTTQLVLVMTLDPDLVARVNDLFYHISAYQPSKNETPPLKSTPNTHTQ